MTNVAQAIKQLMVTLAALAALCGAVMAATVVAPADASQPAAHSQYHVPGGGGPHGGDSAPGPCKTGLQGESGNATHTLYGGNGSKGGQHVDAACVKKYNHAATH